MLKHGLLSQTEKETTMQFQKGNKIEVYKKSEDEAWESYMDDFIGLHGFVTDPDTTINDPDALIEVSLEGKGTHRLPQDCLRLIV
jgi:hypothetical protein